MWYIYLYQKKDGSEGSRPRRAGASNVGGLLPPPPGGSKLPPPPSPQHVPTPIGAPAASNTEWGDFNSARYFNYIIFVKVHTYIT